jgi:nitroreductase/NAD-dependent dihydropyrimidine dehydrogenase PreA subunit
MDHIRILDHCTQCGACVEECPGRVFGRTDRVGVTAPEACIRCGHCVAVCPVDAVSHDGFGGQPFPPIDKSLQLSPDAIRMAIRSRRSVRHFRDRPIPREMLDQLLDMARYTPTASNAQNVGWVAVTDPARRLALSRRVVHWMATPSRLASSPVLSPLVSRITGRNRPTTAGRYVGAMRRMVQESEAGGDPIFHQAPAVLISHSAGGNGLGPENAAYATDAIMLLAQSLGLGTCLIGFFTAATRYDRKLRELAHIPSGHRVTTTVVVGYPIYHYRRLTAREDPKVQWIEAAPRIG